LPEPIVKAQSGPRSAPAKGRTAGIVGVLTVLVAAVGYLREAALAARFGISTTMDAYFAAIFIPSILYLVLIAGTLSPVLIPILLQENPDEDPDKASVTFSVVTNFALLVFAVIVACGTLAARFWLPALFPGFDSSTGHLAVRLIYIVFPALPFLAAAGIATALLNGFHKFWLAAFAPAMASLPVVAAALFSHGDRSIYVVGIATALGFVLQCLVLFPGAAALRVHYRPVLDFRHPALKKVLRLGIPLFLYLAVANAATVLERNLASRISAGAVSTLTYALRLFTVPANFLAAPLAIVAYPGFAREAVREQRGELSVQVSRLFRLLVFVFLPVTVWTILNAAPVTRILYEHGKFSAADSSITARVLAIYSIGIVPNAVTIVLLRCFFAIEDTITPLLTEIVDLGFFVTLATILNRRFGLEGLVTARSLTFVVVMAILVFVLARRGLLTFTGFGQFLFRTTAATLVMGVLSWLIWHLMQPAFQATGTLLRLAMIVVAVCVSAAVFLGFAVLLRLSESRQILSTVAGLVPRWRARGTE
jgi:putative peptidoglycan lipid II flippase